jgi:hypothetical protein
MVKGKPTMTEDIEKYNPDEFIVNDIKSFNYEVMDKNHIWARFSLQNGRTGHLNIFSDGGKISTRYEEWDRDL